MKGWLEVFRDDGGPTWYSYSNRTPVTGDVSLILIFVIFCTLFLAFLIIFPGIRKKRLTTFLTANLSLFVGTAILVAQYGSSWHTSTATIVGSYSAFTKQRMPAEIGGYIGLDHINITYKLLPGSYEDFGDFEYNERFWWRTPNEMGNSFKEALKRGTPFPIISLAEYFSINEEGFSWGRKYREAGHYANFCLWMSFASWMMMIVLLVVVPRYGAWFMASTGVMMLFSNYIYWLFLPSEPLVAHVDGSILIFNFGWNYWMIMVTGIGCMLAAIVILAIDTIFPHSFSTILEVDFDTPYDRHVIIEESFDTKRKDVKKSVRVRNESFKDRIMSRISPKAAPGVRSVTSKREEPRGAVNRGYVPHSNELPLDVSKVNKWSYPFPPTPRRYQPAI